MKKKTICNMSGIGQLLLIFGTLMVYIFIFLIRRQYDLFDKIGHMSNITLDLDSLRMIEMKVGFYSWMSFDRSPYPLNRRYTYLTTVNWKFSDLGSFKGGLLRIATWQNSSTALKEADSITAGSNERMPWPTTPCHFFFFLRVLFFASQESKQW